MMKSTKAIPRGYHTVTPVLTLEEATAAIDWYKKAFGAEELSRNLGPDRQVMHAELQIGDSRIMLHDAMMGGKGPRAFGGSPASLWIYVEDCDALFKRAVTAGAIVKMPVTDAFWGDRNGMLTDPFGYVWTIATHKEDVTPEEMQKRQAAWFKQQGSCPS